MGEFDLNTEKQISELIRAAKRPLTSREISLKLSKSWHSVNTHCLRLQLSGKIKGQQLGKTNLWEKISGNVISNGNNSEQDNVILKVINNQKRPVSSNEISLKLNKSWNSVNTRCLKLQLSRKIKGNSIGKTNLWEKTKGEYLE